MAVASECFCLLLNSLVFVILQGLNCMHFIYLELLGLLRFSHVISYKQMKQPSTLEIKDIYSRE